MSVLNTEDAAELVGVSPFTIRKWVTRGYLAPVRPHAKPVMFREADVIECSFQRKSKAEHDALDNLWRQVLAQW